MYVDVEIFQKHKTSVVHYVCNVFMKFSPFQSKERNLIRTNFVNALFIKIVFQIFNPLPAETNTIKGGKGKPWFEKKNISSFLFKNAYAHYVCICIHHMYIIHTQKQQLFFKLSPPMAILHYMQ